jgi:hypothetical protein
MIESRWTYDTSAGGGVGVGPVSVSRGMFVLDDPSDRKYKYRYETGGLGLGSGLRLPSRLQLPEIKLPRFISKDGTITGTGATTDFFGRGVIYRFKEKELEANDFAGMTLSLEVSAGVLVAAAGTLFLTGLNIKMIAAWIFNPGLFTNALFSTATSMILMGGASEGLIDGISLQPMIGSISYEGPYTQ